MFEIIDSKHPIGEKVVLILDSSKRGLTSTTKVISIVKSWVELDDYGTKYKMDMGVTEDGKEFYEYAMPLAGFFWTQGKSGRRWYRDICGPWMFLRNKEVLDLWKKIKKSNPKVSKLIKYCKKHKNFYYDSKYGCHDCHNNKILFPSCR